MYFHHFESQSHSSDNESESSYRSRENPGDIINWNHLGNKLDAVAAARDIFPSSPSMSSVDCGIGNNSSGPDSDMEGDKGRRNMKKKEFSLHRKAHYNEMEAVKKWQAEHQDDDDDDESMNE